MNRARIVSLAWILLNVISSGILLLALAGTVDLRVTTYRAAAAVISTTGALIADWLLQHAHKRGWYLLFALLVLSAGATVAEFLLDPEVSLGDTAFGLLILSAFTYQLNHSTVRAYANLRPHTWPGKAIFGLAIRVIMYSSVTAVLAETLLDWEIGSVVLSVLLSRELYRGMKHGIQGSQAG